MTNEAKHSYLYLNAGTAGSFPSTNLTVTRYVVYIINPLIPKNLIHPYIFILLLLALLKIYLFIDLIAVSGVFLFLLHVGIFHDLIFIMTKRFSILISVQK